MEVVSLNMELVMSLNNAKFTHKLSLKNVQWQGMTEYIIIVALIAVAGIAAVSFFGEAVQAQVAGLAGSLSGSGSGETVNLATEASTNALGSVSAKSLGDYGH